MVNGEFKDILDDSERALIIGIGGGGDVLGALPTRRLLKSKGIDCKLGSLTYERSQFDPNPGPRCLSEIRNIRQVNEAVALASEETRTYYGLEFQASKMSRYLGEEIFIIDINRGVEGVSLGLKEVCERYNIDLLVGVDVGGDVIADGSEKGLRSPLTDSMMLSALHKIGVKSMIGVFGICCDGELRLDEVSGRLAKIYSEDGFLDCQALSVEDLDVMKNALKFVNTEASMLPLLAAEGKTGDMMIRGGSRRVELSFFSIFTYYLKTDVVFRMSRMAQAVYGSRSFQEAHNSLSGLGITTEYSLQLQRKL